MFVEAIRRAAQIRANEPATICGPRTRTWSQSMDRIARLSEGLRARGARENDRIGILAANSDRYLEAIHATWWSGAVTVPMNTRWSLAEHLYSVDDSDVQILFVDEAFRGVAKSIAEQRSSVRHVIYMGDSADTVGMDSFEALIDSSEAASPVHRSSNELAGIFYTGGTTGAPKGVMHSAHSLWSGSMNLAFDVSVPKTPRYLHVAPMFHLGDLSQAFYVTALAGTHVFVPGFAAEPVIEAMRNHRIQTCLMVPTMIGMLLDHPSFSSAAFATLELLIYGGSPISERLLQRAREGFPKTRLVQGFGQTETNACGTVLHAEEGRSKLSDADLLRTAGRAVYGVELAVLDADCAEVPIGEVGEICLRTQSAMLGYWNKPEETSAALAGGWVHTGDAGYLDAYGFVYVCDRLKDMIISGGENVYSAEVEAAISSHPAVVQVAVVGVPDERWGERVHAVIVPREGYTVTLDELQLHCKQRIAGYKIPRSLEARTQPMPLSGVGKILKRELRAPHWHGKQRAVN